MNKEYLGDGVYIDFDPSGIILTTEHGGSGRATNTIYLETEVLNNFQEYLARLYHEDQVSKENE